MCTDAYREALTRAFSSTAAPSQRQAAEAADPPAAVKTEPSTAMPSTVPTWRSALEVPEAMPSNCPGA